MTRGSCRNSACALPPISNQVNVGLQLSERSNDNQNDNDGRRYSRNLIEQP